jgi:hypothetical protein
MEEKTNRDIFQQSRLRATPSALAISIITALSSGPTRSMKASRLKPNRYAFSIKISPLQNRNSSVEAN